MLTATTAVLARSMASRGGVSPPRQGGADGPTDPDRHRHRWHVHRRGGLRRGDRGDGHHEDTVHPGRPRGGLPGWRAQGARPARGERCRPRRGLPRHHRRDQPAPRGQGRHARLHHDRGLRVPAGDRPPERPGRVRQQLLLGEAAADRAGRPGAHRGRPAGLPGRGGPAVRRTRRPRRRSLVPGPWRRHDRGLPAARLRRPGARGADAGRPRAGAPRRRGLDLQRGAARVPGVRAGDDHAGGRRGQAPGGPLRAEHRGAAGRPRGRRAVLHHEVERGSALGERGGAPADHHRPVRTGGRGARRGAGRPRGRLRPRAHPRRRRHLDGRERGAGRRTDAHHGGHGRRVPVEDPDDRRGHGGRWRRLDRVALPGGDAQGRPALGRRRPRPALLPPRRHRTDHHRRPPAARPDPAAPARRRGAARPGGRHRRHHHPGRQARADPGRVRRPASWRSRRGTRRTRCARSR